MRAEVRAARGIWHAETLEAGIQRIECRGRRNFSRKAPPVDELELGTVLDTFEGQGVLRRSKHLVLCTSTRYGGSSSRAFSRVHRDASLAPVHRCGPRDLQAGHCTAVVGHGPAENPCAARCLEGELAIIALAACTSVLSQWVGQAPLTTPRATRQAALAIVQPARCHTQELCRRDSIWRYWMTLPARTRPTTERQVAHLQRI